MTDASNLILKIQSCEIGRGLKCDDCADAPCALIDALNKTED
jgi:hypothetical protein